MSVLLASGCLWESDPRRQPPSVTEIALVSVDAASDDSLAAPTFGADDWPWWRGPGRDGKSPDGGAPAAWSETDDIVWKAEVPGRGHSSPTVVGDRILLSTADEEEEVQSVLCYDRETGKPLWKTDIHQGGFETEMHKKNSQASSTVACDGTRVFAAFLNNRAIWVTALDLDGKQLWQTEVGGFDSKFGYSASPVIYKSSVLVAGDHQGGGFLAAVHRGTGEILWRKLRPAVATYASPVVAHVSGKDQLLMPGCDLVASYDPNTGDELWSCPGTTEACVGTIVSAGDLVYATGGYPGKQTLCVRADGSQEVVWENNRKAYVPSLLLHEGYLYLVNDDGIGYCWNAATGEQAWQARVGGNFSASPTLAGELIYVGSEQGTVTVFKATPEKYEPVAENRFADSEIFASPVACGGQLFLRVGKGGSNRHEVLYCIGKRRAVGAE